MIRILLGVLDKASMRLGDGASVNFERSLIFMTSNAGARDIGKARSGGYGFSRSLSSDEDQQRLRVEQAGLGAVKRRFPPEFVNRIDHSVVYHPLTRANIATIFDRQIDIIEHHIAMRLGPRAFELEISAEAREFLIREGSDPASGARELKRTLHRRLMQPLARMVLAGAIPPGAFVRVEKARAGGLAIRPRLPRRIAS
jgi:ATP-dependent Clp protease ATP-binding subunit ClpC